jgi:hypothetical protein
VAGEGRVVVVDLEKDCVAINVERAKVVLFVWIVGITEIVVNGDGLENPRDDLITESGNARR